MVPSGGCVCSAGPSVTSQSWAVKVWITPGRDTSYDAFTWRWRWRRDAREVTPARASEDTQVSLSLSHSLHLSLCVCVCVCLLFFMSLISSPAIRQGGGVRVPAGELSSAPSPLERQCHSVQRLCWWHRPSMEHPKCQCNSFLYPYDFHTALTDRRTAFTPKFKFRCYLLTFMQMQIQVKFFFFVVHKTFCSNSTAAKSTKQLKWTWTIKRLLTPHPSQSKCLRPWGFRADLKIHYLHPHCTVELVHPLQRGWALTYLAL